MRRFFRRLWRLVWTPPRPTPAPLPPPREAPPAALDAPTPPRPLRTRYRRGRLTGEVGVTCHEGRVWICYPVRLSAVAMSPAETRTLAHALWAAALEAERAAPPAPTGLFD